MPVKFVRPRIVKKLPKFGGGFTDSVCCGCGRGIVPGITAVHGQCLALPTTQYRTGYVCSDCAARRDVHPFTGWAGEIEMRPFCKLDPAWDSARHERQLEGGKSQKGFNTSSVRVKGSSSAGNIYQNIDTYGRRR
jgi:hypothetical protein